MTDVEKLDPFDVEALQKSVDDSAARLSTVWVSFIVFALYLEVAAGSTTDRQLLLEQPMTLPVLNINLPLLGFFLLAPVLLVIFHAYLLLQVLLLARTAAVYDEAVQRSSLAESDRARVQQRLSNTLFAQIFAGSPRERRGVVGVLLRVMAWVTLAIAPAFVLLTFEVQFIPYHSGAVTWTHRVLIAIDMTIVLLLWRAVFNPERDVLWHEIIEPRPALFTAIAVVLFSNMFVTFPGELPASWMRFGDEIVRDCNPLLGGTGFKDRILVPREILVDGEWLVKIEAATKEKGQKANEGPRSRNFRSRDLRCGQFDFADLRRSDFTEANLQGARFSSAELQGAVLTWAQIEGANFSYAKLQESSFRNASFPASDFRSAQLQGADLSWAHADGSNFDFARMEGASLWQATLRGSTFDWAYLQGANFWNAKLQGAQLLDAQLEGARLDKAQLQGANLGKAQVSAASLNEAQLQGSDLSKTWLHYSLMDHAQLQAANLEGTLLAGAVIRGAYLWRASGADCLGAEVEEPRLANVLGENGQVQLTGSAIDNFIEQAALGVPGAAKQKLQERLRRRLVTDPNEDKANEEVWRQCELSTRALGNFDPDGWAKEHARLLVKVACGDGGDREGQVDVAKAIYLAWFKGASPGAPGVQVFARGVLGLGGKPCPIAKKLDKEITDRLGLLVSTNPSN
jgi:uncharacterized protein YjbI with pentapeptide repeats